MNPSPRPARAPRTLGHFTPNWPQPLSDPEKRGTDPAAWVGGTWIYPISVQIRVLNSTPTSYRLATVLGRRCAIPHCWDFSAGDFGGVRITHELLPGDQLGGRHVSVWVRPELHGGICSDDIEPPEPWVDLSPVHRIQLTLKRLSWMLHGLAATHYHAYPDEWGGTCPALESWKGEWGFIDGTAVTLIPNRVVLTTPETY